MPRIFACLAIGEILVIFLAGGLGLAKGENASNQHAAVGLFALLLACLIQIVAFTYLTVTGKMITQVVHLARMALDPLRESKRIKRRSTFLMAAAVMPILLVAATAGTHWRTGAFRWGHFLAAVLLFGVHVCVFVLEYTLLVANRDLLDRTLADYSEIRERRLHSATSPAANGQGSEADPTGERLHGSSTP